MRALVALVVAMSASGCLALGDCDGREPSVTFDDPGLFSDLGVRSPAGWTVEQGPLDWGLPVGNLTLDDHYGALNVLDVTGPETGLPPAPELAGRDDGSPRLRLGAEQDGAHAYIDVYVASDQDPEALRRPTLLFLENVTTWSEAQRASWTDRFVASRQPMLDGSYRSPDGTLVEETVYGHASTLDAPLQLARLVDRLFDGAPTPVPDDHNPTIVGLADAHGWDIRFTAPLRRATGPEGTIDAYPWGAHSFRGDWPRKDIGADAALADLHVAHARLGRPAATNATYSFAGSVC